MSVFDRPIREHMSRPVKTVSADASVDDAAGLLERAQISSLLVVSAEGLAVGVLSRTDLLRGRGGRVGERMSQPVIAAPAEASVASVARTLWSRRIHRVYVLDAGRPAGVFSTRELLLAVRDSKLVTPLADLMSTPVLTVEADRPVAEALARLTSAGVGGLVVVENEHPVGLFTQREALAATALPEATTVDEVMTPALLCLRTTIPAHRAAAFGVATRARRILVVHHHEMKGVVSGLDFARLVGGEPTPVAAENVAG
jgi:CBS domain-containing protein